MAATSVMFFLLVGVILSSFTQCEVLGQANDIWSGKILCIRPDCWDPVTLPGELCETCPTGPNCKVPGYDIIISADENLTLEDGTVCTCVGRRIVARCHNPSRRPRP